jgi:hypothetical protein
MRDTIRLLPPPTRAIGLAQATDEGRAMATRLALWLADVAAEATASGDTQEPSPERRPRGRTRR